jgi:hypothetical protein
VNVVAVVVRTMPAPTAPKADTGPKASVAVFVPAPERATPETSELNTSWMEPFTVALTVSTPFAVWATAADEIIISAAKMVNSTTFLIVVPLLNSNFKKLLLKNLLCEFAVRKLNWP